MKFRPLFLLLAVTGAAHLTAQPLYVGDERTVTARAESMVLEELRFVRGSGEWIAFALETTANGRGVARAVFDDAGIVIEEWTAILPPDARRLPELAAVALQQGTVILTTEMVGSTPTLIAHPVSSDGGSGQPQIVGEGRVPVAASDGLEALVAWVANTRGGDIVVRKIGADAVPRGEARTLASGPSWQNQPALAFHQSNFLVAWSEASASECEAPSCSIQTNILAFRLGLDAAPLHLDPLQVTGAAFSHSVSSAAAAGAFLVSWDSMRGIRGRQIESDGSMSGNDRGELLAADPDDLTISASVVSTGVEHVVAWEYSPFLHGAGRRYVGRAGAPSSESVEIGPPTTARPSSPRLFGDGRGPAVLVYDTVKFRIVSTEAPRRRSGRR